jgi:regulator of sirC expression with transglutaminase-like and TPR domain
LDRPDSWVEEIALAIADDAYPGLDPAPFLRTLDEQARAIAPRIHDAPDLRQKYKRLRDYLVDDLGYSGNHGNYYDPRNSYLNEVIDRRTGVPIALCVVWLAVARRLNLPAAGIGFPGRFLLRLGDTESSLTVDAFADGRIMSSEALEGLAKRLLGGPPPAWALEESSAGEIASRMLRNLKNVYQKRADHAHAMLCCDRLIEIQEQPAPEHHRDRGIHALALHAFEAASRDLARYVLSRPDATDVAQVKAMLEQARSKAKRHATN